jgi:uncharacterized protein (DUF58 family)
LLALAAPLVASVALSQAAEGSRPHTLSATIETQPDRCLEGDATAQSVTLTSSGGNALIEVAVPLPPGVEVAGGARHALFVVNQDEPCLHRVELTAPRWGAYRVGGLALRRYSRGRFLVTDETIPPGRVLKVYPSFERLSSALSPPETQTHSGDHVSRAGGDGIEFAAVRPYTPGDSVRRVNWRVTGRTNELHVNVAHPERNADVVMFLDTFTNAATTLGTTLDLAIKGAAAISRHHLAHNDRIGVIAFGGTLRWLTSSMGRTHAYRIAEFLLDVDATFSYAWKDLRWLPARTLHPGALVIAFSPLVDERAVRALVDIGARGFPLYVIDTLPERCVPPGESAGGRLARRLWKLGRAAKRARLEAAGVVTWPAEGGVEAALEVLRRRSAGRPVSRR